MKQKYELKGEIDKSSIIVGDFNTHFQQLRELLDKESARI